MKHTLFILLEKIISKILSAASATQIHSLKISSSTTQKLLNITRSCRINRPYYFHSGCKTKINRHFALTKGKIKQLFTCQT